MKKNNDEDIKVVIMNPECITSAQKKLFNFFHEKHINKIPNEARNK